jgi:hypothetical protein
MAITRQELQRHGFVHSHDLVLDEKSAKFLSKNAALIESASIYLWLSPESNSADNYSVLYIGKAGYGLRRRFSQHVGGFKNSATGKSNLRLIIDHIESGKEIQVFARNSSTISLFGAEVSLYSTEEEAMCSAYASLWNRATFPALPAENKPDASSRKENSAPLIDMPIDFSQCTNADDIHSFYAGLSREGKTNFIQLLNLVSDIPSFNEMPQKIICGYTSQPSGYNNTPMLIFSPIGPNGRALGGQWGVRIPLVDVEGGKKPLTIIVNEKFINPSLSEALIARGQDSFRPLDLDDFLSDPRKYLTVA